MKKAKFVVLTLILFGITADHVCSQFNPETHAEAIQETKRGRLITESLSSAILRENRTGLDPHRTVKVYLPSDYTTSGKSYPVVYYFHNIFWSPEQMFEDGNLEYLLDKGFANGIVKEFIFVAADYSTPTTGSLYENSLITGRWHDFTVEELVPFIDSRFRTLRHRDSRALAGDYMGGRGALTFAMLYPEVFSVVYALNPVATGIGMLPMPSLPNWEKILQAESFDDLHGDHISQIYVTMSQAILPNFNRPPFYCDFMMEMEDGKPKLHVENARKLRADFLLDHMLELNSNAENLGKLSGVAFDWARYDPIQDHVHGNQSFTRALEKFGIEHEAEEYRGVQSTENWTANGRFYARLLPFFNRHLVFEVQK